MKKQSLPAADLQLILDSAGNAADHGLNQFLTPGSIASALMAPLPPEHARPVAVDLQMGAGSLLFAAGSRHLLGCDLDRTALAEANTRASNLQRDRYFHHADCTLLAPLLAEANCRFDSLFANPPFSMRWHRDRLAFLAESDCPAVAAAFPKAGDYIDSTLATLCILLDRSTDLGEGFMICNHNTAVRLFGHPNGEAAIGAEPREGHLDVERWSRMRDGRCELASHIWLWLTLPPGTFPEAPSLEPAVLYFARSHTDGPQFHLPITDLLTLSSTLAPFAARRSLFRHGSSHFGAYTTRPEETIERWRIATAEYRARHGQQKQPQWNLFLDRHGRIHRHLTPFQQISVRIPREDIKLLDKLQDQTPMALVVQKPTRLALQRAIASTYWTVHPDLIAAVEKAIAEYNAHRAPFYPLNPIQSLGWLDEEDFVTCTRDLEHDGRTLFRAGQRYPLLAATVGTTRKINRPNLLGQPQECTLHGKELVVTLTGDSPCTFGEAPDCHFKWPTFLDHFAVPDVPDVARVHPERYRAHLAWLTAFEANGMRPPTASPLKSVSP